MCLARYSPRTTTTNQPTKRAPNEPARPLCAKESIFWGQKWPFWGQTSKSFGREQKFWYPHNGALCAKLLMVRTMLQSTKTFDTKLVRYIEWSNVQPWVHHISPIWPHYGHFGPKNSQIWPYLAIGSLSDPKLVEHWLNMVEHRSPHLGWATWTPLHSPKWPWGAWEGPQNGHF